MCAVLGLCPLKVQRDRHVCAVLGVGDGLKEKGQASSLGVQKSPLLGRCSGRQAGKAAGRMVAHRCRMPDRWGKC